MLITDDSYYYLLIISQLESNKVIRNIKIELFALGKWLVIFAVILTQLYFWLNLQSFK